MVHAGADTENTPPACDDPAWTAADWRKLKFRDAVWVRTIVEVQPGFSDGGHPMGLFLNATASAEVWWDGEMIGRNGRPNSTAVGELPGRIQEELELDDLQLQAGGHRLRMGIWQQPGRAIISKQVEQVSLG